MRFDTLEMAQRGKYIIFTTEIIILTKCKNFILIPLFLAVRLTRNLMK